MEIHLPEPEFYKGVRNLLESSLKKPHFLTDFASDVKIL